MAGQFLQEVKTMQYLVSRELEIITPNQIDQDNIPPPAPLVSTFDIETICETDNVQLKML